MRRLLNFIAEVVWALGWLYVPDRDGAPLILPKALEETVTAQMIRERFAALRRFDGSEGSPDYRQPAYTADAAIWDRKGWKISGDDGAVWDPGGGVSLSIGDSTQRKNYMIVRPLVVMGWPATKIAAHLGKSERWAEEYVAAVRASFWLRFSGDLETEAPTPLPGETAEFAGSNPQ